MLLKLWRISTHGTNLSARARAALTGRPLTQPPSLNQATNNALGGFHPQSAGKTSVQRE